MITKETVTLQIARLMGLNYFPKGNKEAEQDLVSALCAASDDAIAMHVVNEWVAGERDCPKPADLRKLIWEENEKRKPEQTAEETRARGNCSQCRGYGIRESIHVDNLESIASYCDCEDGRHRRMDAGRDPYSVDRVNAARQKLLSRFGNNPLKRIAQQAASGKRTEQMAIAEDVYRGEF